MIRFRSGNVYESEVVQMFTKNETHGESWKKKSNNVCGWMKNKDIWDNNTNKKNLA